MKIWKYKYTKNRVLGKTFLDMARTIWHFWINKRVMVCDVQGQYDELQHKEYFDRQTYWTDAKTEDLHAMGYRACKNCPDFDNLAWLGVPVVIKLYNIKTIETEEKDNPSFLNDRINNNLLNRFAKSLARAALMGGMDMQKIVFMGIIAVGAIVGMKVLGVF